MNPFGDHMTGLVVDSFLQYPVACSLAFCMGLFIFYPVFYETDATKGWRWFVSCVAVFVLLSAVSIFLKPTLSMTADRIIFRPTPSCSTFDNPARYLCFTLSDPGHDQVFYTTTWRKCDNSDANMRNASKFYIISSWIPSFDHFITKRSVNFEPEGSPSEDKKSFILPENYCVRAAGPLGEDNHTEDKPNVDKPKVDEPKVDKPKVDKLKVAFYSINGSRHHLLDSGYINKTELEKFNSGWYLVSSCKSELSKWLFNCTSGYVSSNYVRLQQYTRRLLLEQRGELPS
ncbi:uncharacterized protein [Montipora foliosa]|uniref:uncharacterized protein n=1 Tax=Montipora foliosa TaxID=591990 RepID=UPI0035F12AFF